MDISWGDLGAAVALMLIIEGIMPFVNPGTFRQMLEMVSKMEERSVRTLGAIWIGLGIALLYWVRG
mgnify:FL=1